MNIHTVTIITDTQACYYILYRFRNGIFKGLFGIFLIKSRLRNLKLLHILSVLTHHQVVPFHDLRFLTVKFHNLTLFDAALFLLHNFIALIIVKFS